MANKLDSQCLKNRVWRPSGVMGIMKVFRLFFSFLKIVVGSL